MKTKGFTIVELLIVIVVIGILAAITLNVFIGVQEKARFATMKTDLKAITKALAAYQVEQGAYPISIGQPNCNYSWCGWNQVTGNAFIPGLSPDYMSSIPQLPQQNASDNTYLYQSNGTDYQLIRYNPAGLTNAESTDNPLLAVGNGYDGIAWGYKTNATWW